MAHKRWLFLSLAALLLLAGCQKPDAEPLSFYVVINDLPGVRIALNAALPATVGSTLGQVYRAHQTGRDVWLSADEESLSEVDPSGDFRAWLRATRPVLFHAEAGDVHFIPASGSLDRLSFILDHHLEKWADEEQVAHWWQARGDDLRSQGAFAAATEAYGQALSLDPGMVTAHVGLGAALLGQGKNAQALKTLLLATSLDPQDYWAQRLLGNAYLKLQRYEMAVTPLTQAYLLKPQDTHLLLGVALGLGRSGHPRQALRILDEAARRITDSRTLNDIKTLKIEFAQSGD